MSKITHEYMMSTLRRGVLVNTSRGKSPKNIAFAGALELANLGFIVDPSELEKVSTSMISDAIKSARAVIGADRDMTPVYPGFPQQVAELSTLTLLMEQILHYWTMGAFLPDYPTVAREGLPLEDMLHGARELRVLTASQYAQESINDFVKNPVALSDGDKELLVGAVEVVKSNLTAEKIAQFVIGARNGENIQSFVRALCEKSVLSSRDIALAVLPVLQTPDSILRVVLSLFGERVTARKNGNSSTTHEEVEESYQRAVNHLSDKDSWAVRMLNIPRPVRKMVVRKLGECTKGYFVDPLVTKQNLWRKVASAIHPYDYVSTDAERRAMDILHSNIEYKTLNSVVEVALAEGDAVTVIKTLAEYQSSGLLRRVVAVLRIVKNEKEAKLLAKSLEKVGSKASLTTLISAYNGILSANSENATVARVAGQNNFMFDRSQVVKVDEDYLKLVLRGVKKAIKSKLAEAPAPKAPVACKSDVPVPLVRRDASTSDRILDRGETIALAGEGNTIRFFGHFVNNQSHAGYMDVGVTFLDSDCKILSTLTWNTWSAHRGLGTYSGDKHVYPGDHASEFYDIDLAKLKKKYPNAKYAAMTIISYSGWKINDVDMIAGAMIRTKPNSGEVFDARTVVSAFKPTTSSLQAVPLVVNLDSNDLVWIDSSNGSTQSGVSSANDVSIGDIVHSELVRERLTYGKLAKWWANAHKVETVNKPVDTKSILALL